MSDPKAPPAAESTNEMLAAYTHAFPDILKITNDAILPTAQKQLQATQATSPALMALQAQLYNTYGPQLAQTANKIAQDQAMAQAQSDKAVMAGPGQDLVKQAIDTQKMADPEYYAMRGQVSGKTGDLLNSIDLSGKLTPGESEAMQRQIAQENSQRGLSTAPSQTAVAENAMTFGDKLHQRQAQAKDQLTNALATANNALPAMKSGMDTFQISTGRSSQGNAGDNKFIGADTSLGQSAQGMGQNLLGQIGGFVQQKNDINANRRDELDRFNQTWGSVVGSL